MDFRRSFLLSSVPSDWVVDEDGVRSLNGCVGLYFSKEYEWDDEGDLVPVDNEPPSRAQIDLAELVCDLLNEAKKAA